MRNICSLETYLASALSSAVNWICSTSRARGVGDAQSVARVHSKNTRDAHSWPLCVDALQLVRILL